MIYIAYEEWRGEGGGRIKRTWEQDIKHIWQNWISAWKEYPTNHYSGRKIIRDKGEDKVSRKIYKLK